MAGPAPPACSAWLAGCQCCMRSGRWSATRATPCTCSGPRRADRRSTSWCQLSLRAWSSALRPTTPAGGSRLALAWGMGTVCRARRAIWLTGAASGVRARCSASRRRRWARACVGWAVRTGSACQGGTGLPSTLRRSWCQASSSASTPCWRACNQACSACSKAWADHSSASAEVASAGSSAARAKVSGSSSQVCVWGASPKAQSSACKAAAPSRRATPSRGKARNWPQVLQPMRARLATWGRSAVRVCRGKSCGTRRGGRSPACCSRSSARAWNDVAPWAKGAGGGCTRGNGDASQATGAGSGATPVSIAGALACSWASSAARPPHRRSVVETSSSSASSTRATLGVKRSAHQASAPCTVCHVGVAPGTPPDGACACRLGSAPATPGAWALGGRGSTGCGHGQAIQCMCHPLPPTGRLLQTTQRSTTLPHPERSGQRQCGQCCRRSRNG